MVMSRAPTLTRLCLWKILSISPRANTFRNGHPFFVTHYLQPHVPPSSLLTRLHVHPLFYKRFGARRTAHPTRSLLRVIMSSYQIAITAASFPLRSIKMENVLPRSGTFPCVPLTHNSIYLHYETSCPPAQNLSLLSALFRSSLRKTSHGGHQAQRGWFAYVPPRS